MVPCFERGVGNADECADILSEREGTTFESDESRGNSYLEHITRIPFSSPFRHVESGIEKSFDSHHWSPSMSRLASWGV
jgi:hypothetical protein